MRGKCVRRAAYSNIHLHNNTIIGAHFNRTIFRIYWVQLVLCLHAIFCIFTHFRTANAAATQYLKVKCEQRLNISALSLASKFDPQWRLRFSNSRNSSLLLNVFVCFIQFYTRHCLNTFNGLIYSPANTHFSEESELNIWFSSKQMCWIFQIGWRNFHWNVWIHSSFQCIRIIHKYKIFLVKKPTDWREMFQNTCRLIRPNVAGIVLN